MNIYVDIDQTICTGDFPYDECSPYPKRIAKINDLRHRGHNITYWTARGCHSGNDFTKLTRNQLEEWGCKYHHLVVGTKPHFDMYICDKSFNSESFFHYKESGLP